MSEWWESLIVPAFCIGIAVYLGLQLNAFEKIGDFFGKIKGDREFNISFKSLNFEGIGNFFRRS